MRRAVQASGIPQPFELMYQPPLRPPAIPLHKILRTEIFVDGPIAHDVVDDHQDRVPDRHRRPALPPPCRQSPVLRFQIRAFLAGRRMCRLHQLRPQPDIPFARPATALRARALVTPRAHPRPTRQMTGAREAAHVGADFGEQRFGDVPPDPRDRIEAIDQIIGGLQFFICQ